MAGPRPHPTFRLRRSARIRQGGEIRSLLRTGERERTRHFDIFYAASTAPHPRFGMIVPKHRHNAVDRNRLRRRIREVGRTVVLPLLRASERTLDVMVRARAGAYRIGFAELRRELESKAQELCCSGSC